MKIQFLGAAQTVTGSRFLVSAGGKSVLVDCGLFQGLKELRLRNWDRFPVDPASIDAVLLTHAHIDHSGYLPKLTREGFKGPIYATPGTIELLRIMLPDSAHLQQEEAEFANRHGYSKHKPALPLYTLADAMDALGQVRYVNYGQTVSLGSITARYSPAGHLLGSATIEVAADGRKVLFSGDLGRYNIEVSHDPQRPGDEHAIVVESTYGNRGHQDVDVEKELTRIVKETVSRRGILLIPAFAVGRSQILLYYFHKLECRGDIPRLPTFVDSPMAVDATALYVQHADDPNVKMKLGGDHDPGPLRCFETHFVRTREESKELNGRTEPCIIISASGMATGGRVLHHLRRLLPDKRNTVLLVGYQSVGTRGRLLQDGADTVKMLGEQVSVRAKIENISAFSAHGDADDLVQWIRSAPRPPSTVFLVHGEPAAQEALAERLRKETPSDIKIPAHLQTFEL